MSTKRPEAQAEARFGIGHLTVVPTNADAAAEDEASAETDGSTGDGQ